MFTIDFNLSFTNGFNCAGCRIKPQGERNRIILPGKSGANYINAVKVGNLLFLAGKGPLKADKTYVTGKVGKDLTIEQGYEAARLTAISHLEVLKEELGSLQGKADR